MLRTVKEWEAKEACEISSRSWRVFGARLERKRANWASASRESLDKQLAKLGGTSINWNYHS